MPQGRHIIMFKSYNVDTISALKVTRQHLAVPVFYYGNYHCQRCGGSCSVTFHALIHLSYHTECYKAPFTWILHGSMGIAYHSQRTQGNYLIKFWYYIMDNIAILNARIYQFYHFSMLYFESLFSCKVQKAAILSVIDAMKWVSGQYWRLQCICSISLNAIRRIIY